MPIRDAHGEEPIPINAQLPRFEARSFSAVIVDAPTEATDQAIRALDPEQVGRAVPGMQLMGWMRAMPARVGARRRAPAGPGPKRSQPRSTRTRS